MPKSATQNSADASTSPSCQNKYRIVFYAASINVIILIVGFILMMTYVVPGSSKHQQNAVIKSQPTLQFAPLHAFPFLPITDFQEIDTVIVPITQQPNYNYINTNENENENIKQFSTNLNLPSQRLYRVEAVDQFDGTSSTRLFLSMNHILDISPSSAALYDEERKILSDIRFFVGEKTCNETAAKDCNIIEQENNNFRQLTGHRAARNSGNVENKQERNNRKDSEENEDSSDGGRDGPRVRIRSNSNMAMLSEAAAQGGIIIDASLIEISDVVDGLGTLSGNFGSLGIQGVNGLGGVNGAANGINDFATVTNGLGGINPIGNSLLGDRNTQPGRTFMSVQSVPTVGVVQTDVASYPTLTYAAVPSVYTVPTIAVASVPWGVHYVPSTSPSTYTASTRVATNILCANNLCYSVIPTN